MALFSNNTPSEDPVWTSASDMMAGLMMIFLFIAIIYIQNIGQYFDAVSDLQDQICRDLSTEFEEEKNKWNMTVCENGLLIRFDNDSIFESNSAVLSAEFKVILSSFFPRLLDVIWKYKENISELRIEGHTDSSHLFATELEGYLYNTGLSQSRSRKVMEYSLNLKPIDSREEYLEWAFHNITAHGMSSSEPVLTESMIEDQTRSRRVEFRLRTKAEDNLIELVKEIGGNET